MTFRYLKKLIKKNRAFQKRNKIFTAQRGFWRLLPPMPLCLPLYRNGLPPEGTYLTRRQGGVLSCGALTQLLINMTTGTTGAHREHRHYPRPFARSDSLQERTQPLCMTSFGSNELYRHSDIWMRETYCLAWNFHPNLQNIFFDRTQR